MRRKLLIIIMVATSALSFAQGDFSDKYSASTQLFLSELRGEVQLPKTNVKEPMVMTPFESSPINLLNEPNIKKFRTRTIAEAEMVNGVKMISAFIGVNDDNFDDVEALGVVVESRFKNLMVALIPVDKIEDVARLNNVTLIEVAEILQPLNDQHRIVTQAGDAISNSAAAQALGLTKQYTGKGVILGIVDSGIDFQHIAFKDINGNNRIVRAYKLRNNSTSLYTYSSVTDINGLTYDTNTGDHGTHTSTTAGGSSVIVNGNNVTVTDDHANATYGGMAPEADLVIAGLSSLYTTSIGSAIQNICNYADQVGKPCVISLSLGSQTGAHDGTGSIANIISQCAGNNHIIVYAAANDAMRSDYFKNVGTSNGGGMYASGTSTKSKPVMANLQRSWKDATGNVQLYASSINAYARTSGVATALKFHVVDTSTGNIVYSSSEYTSGATISLTSTTGLAQYFKSSTSYSNPYGDIGIIRISRSTSNNKYYWTIYTPTMTSTSYSKNSLGIYESKYALCVSVYPTNNSSTIVDMWEGYGVNWFGNDLELSSTASNRYNLVRGNDDCSINDNACYEKVISVGAFVSKNSITDYAGNTHDSSEDYPNIGDHAYFSSYQAAGSGPLGTALPTINAPGARIVAGINHYHTKSVDDKSYWADDKINDLVVNNSQYAYGAMEGTSMATPCVSGIVAQWLQACLEVGKTPSPDYIKEVMAATWDTDEWTNGTGNGAHGAKTFGTHGKINAIKGIQYILGVTGGPTISASPTSLTLNATTGKSTSKTFNVKGVSLEDNVTATISDANNVFNLNNTSISITDATNGKDITVTFSPKANGTFTGTITLTSSNAKSVTVALNGVATPPEIITDPETLSFNAIISNTDSKTFGLLGKDLSGNVKATLIDDNGVFSINPSNTNASAAEEGATFTVTFSPLTAGVYTGKVNLSTQYAESITVQLTGTAVAPELSADPAEITFDEIEARQTTTKTFEVTGTNLLGNVTATVTNGSDVFGIDPTSISKEDAESDNGKTITVTFSPSEQGTYIGLITLSSDRAESITVQLNATATKAMPDYFDVVINNVGLTTLYLDFPVQIPYQTYDPDLLGVYYLTERKGNELRAARLNKDIPANTGVIVQGNQGTYRFPKTKNPTALKYESILLGSVEDITPAQALAAAQSDGTIYTLGRGSDSYINFYRYSGNMLTAYKAFLILEDNNAKSLSMIFEDGTTGILSVDANIENGAWYTVEGIKLQSKPTHKGVYIHEGKSIIIK